jgi:Spy/CpxP family protein refolding chaperone
MSSRLTQVLLALSLLLNCFVLAGFVYRSWIAPPHWHGRMGGSAPGQPGYRGPLEALSQDLELDDTQKQALKGLFEQYSTARRDRFREIHKVREAMSAELQKPEFDMTRIEPLVEQMTRLRAEQQKENLRSISQLSPHLRPEQRDELHKILAERYGGGWRGRSGETRTPRPPQ